MIVGHCTQGTPGGCLLEKHGQEADQHSGNQCSVKVFLVDQDAAIEQALEGDGGIFRHADVDLVDVAAKNGLPDTVQKVADPQRGHQ